MNKEDHLSAVREMAHGNVHLAWRGVLACCFICVRHVHSS